MSWIPTPVFRTNQETVGGCRPMRVRVKVISCVLGCDECLSPFLCPSPSPLPPQSSPTLLSSPISPQLILIVACCLVTILLTSVLAPLGAAGASV